MSLMLFWAALASASKMIDLFDSMDNKPIPLHLCNSWTDGVKWRIPSTMDCPLIDTERPSKVVNITLWFEDISLVKVESYECFSITTKDEKNWFFMGGSTHVVTKHKSGMNKDQCKHMVVNKEDPEGAPLTHLRDGQFGTNKEVDNDYSWPGKTVAYVTNYYYVSLSLVVSNEDSSVQTTTKLTEKCFYQNMSCPTELGLLIWDNHHSQSTCRLSRGISTTCLYTDNRLSCPEENLSITMIKQKSMCNMTMGYSSQGIIFTEDGRKNRVLTTTPTHIMEIIVDVNHKSRSRKKRSPTNPTNPNHEDTLLSAAQVNGKLQYLYDVVNKSISYNVQQIHLEICNQNRRTLQMLRILAEGGQTSLLVRILLGEGNYRSTLSGDVLSVYKCEKIYQYIMVPRREDQCISDWPIQYMLKFERKSGFLSPLSHEIIETPNTVNCPPPDFYFDTGDDVFLLTNKTIVTHLPILPKPSESMRLKHLPDLSFSGVGVFKASSLSSKETILELVRDMKHNLKFDQVIQATLESKTLTPEQSSFVYTILQTLTSPFRSLLINIGNSVVAFIVVIIILRLVWAYRREIKQKVIKDRPEVSRRISQYFENKRALRRFKKKNRMGATEEPKISKARERLVKFSSEHSLKATPPTSPSPSKRIAPPPPPPISQALSDPQGQPPRSPAPLRPTGPLTSPMPPRSPKPKAPLPPTNTQPILAIPFDEENSHSFEGPSTFPSAPISQNPYLDDFEIINEGNELYPCLAITRPRCNSCSRRGTRKVAYKVRKHL